MKFVKKHHRFGGTGFMNVVKEDARSDWSDRVHCDVIMHASSHRSAY